MNVQSSSVHNVQIFFEATQICFHDRIDNEAVMHLYNKILHSNKLDLTIDTYDNIIKSQRHYGVQKKIQFQKAAYCMISFI